MDYTDLVSKIVNKFSLEDSYTISVDPEGCNLILSWEILDIILDIYIIKDAIVWSLHLGHISEIRFISSTEFGLFSGSVDEAIHFIKHLLSAKIVWNNMIDSNTYWESEETETGYKFITDKSWYKKHGLKYRRDKKDAG